MQRRRGNENVHLGQPFAIDQTARVVPSPEVVAAVVETADVTICTMTQKEMSRKRVAKKQAEDMRHGELGLSGCLMGEPIHDGCCESAGRARRGARRVHVNLFGVCTLASTT